MANPPLLLTRGLAAIVLFIAAPLAEAQEPAPARYVGPWNLESLREAPIAEWRDPKTQPTGVVLQEVYYQGEAYRGRPTRVFGWFALPAERSTPVPAVVLVHGGGGTAFAEWATRWAERGYAALAMDLTGHGPGRERLSDGGPHQTDQEIFAAIATEPLSEMWTYHAVAAVIRGHSLIAARPEVDAQRIAITGISWGGYLTCIVAGLDDRFKAAVPVYGCGFLHENSAWLRQLADLGDEPRRRWIENFDPSRYLPGVRCPMLFVNGTNDFAYPLDSYQKSYQAVASPVTLCVTVRMPHSHPAGWAPQEIGIFIDALLGDGVPLAKVAPLQIDGAVAKTSFDSPTRIVTAQFHYTTDAGPWMERVWKSAPAKIEEASVLADVPTDRPLIGFLTLTDDRNAIVSTPHVFLP